MSEVEDRIFAAVAARNLVRPSVRAIILHDGNILVQRPADSAPGGSYAFIGGEYEIGDTFESRLRRELEEETTARLVTWRYLFVVENLFVHAGHRIHALEHYVLATIETTDVQSREGHLVQEWLPLHSAADVDLRPFAVRICSPMTDMSKFVMWSWTAGETGRINSPPLLASAAAIRRAVSRDQCRHAPVWSCDPLCSPRGIF